MVLFFDPEVLLANLLQNSIGSGDGVTWKEIGSYCHIVKKALSELPEWNEVTGVSFDMDSRSLSDVVARYPEYFRKFNGSYHRGPGFNIHRFDQRTDERLRDLLAKAAKEAMASSFSEGNEQP